VPASCLGNQPGYQTDAVAFVEIALMKEQQRKEKRVAK
jgi:hypothetical protein